MRKHRFLGILVGMLLCCSCTQTKKVEVENTSPPQPTEMAVPVAPSVTTEKENNVEKSTIIEKSHETTEITETQTTKEGDGVVQKSTVENATSPIPRTSTPLVNPTTKEVATATTSVSSPPESTATTQNPPTQAPEVAQKQNGVTIAIYNGDETIMEPVDISIEEKESVFDVLKKATKAQQISLDFNGNGSTVYVMGIDNLYQFDDGPESGWVYRVNGVYGSASSGSCKVSSGDVIEWVYMKNASKQATGN